MGIKVKSQRPTTPTIRPIFPTKPNLKLNGRDSTIDEIPNKARDTIMIMTGI